jgi:hypothetical protein
LTAQIEQVHYKSIYVLLNISFFRLSLQIEKYKWWVMLPDAPYYDGYNTLENTSEEIHSNRPYPSFGIWLYDFNFKIYRTHFDSVFFFYYDIEK